MSSLPIEWTTVLCLPGTLTALGDHAYSTFSPYAIYLWLYFGRHGSHACSGNKDPECHGVQPNKNKTKPNKKQAEWDGGLGGGFRRVEIYVAGSSSRSLLPLGTWIPEITEVWYFLLAAAGSPGWTKFWGTGRWWWLVLCLSSLVS